MPVQDRTDLRRRLLAIAARQSGYFTAAQALDAGYSYPAQGYHAKRGNWLRVDRGIYRFPEWPTGPREDLVRWSLWSRDRAHVHLTVPPNFRQKNPGVVIHRADLAPRDVEEHEGFRVTTPLRSLLDVAAGELDLDQLAQAIAEALARGMTTRRALLDRADEFGANAALRIERALQGVERDGV